VSLFYCMPGLLRALSQGLGVFPTIVALSFICYPGNKEEKYSKLVINN